MATLAEIRAKLQAASQKSTSGAAGGDNAIFPFWDKKIPDGSTTTVRFLDDGDKTNDYFWIEKAMIKLPFAGVKGDTNSKPVIVPVPCMEMWNQPCPILAEVRPWYKDKSLEEMAGKYWKKRSYLLQGFVTETKLQEETVPENPIRRFMVNSQIFNLIKNGVLDPEIEVIPTDTVRGLDFKITKTAQGKYADYSTSMYARRERALSEAELAAIDQYGLFKLSDFLPKKPGEVELKVMMEMFEASVDGEAFDTERWGQYFKPSGMGANNSPSASTTSAPPSYSAPKPVATPSVTEDEDLPFDADLSSSVTTPAPTANGDAGSRAADIIAMIRNRNQAK